MRLRRVRPTLAALAIAVVTAAIAAACGGKHVTKLDLQLQLLSPAGDSQPLAGISTVKVTVLQDGTAGVGVFSASEPWSVPAANADLKKPVVVQIEGLASDGSVVKIGRTRPVTPKTAGTHVYGVFFSPPDSWSPPPATIPSKRFGAAVAALPDGRVVVAGGQDGAGATQASIYVYDPDAGTFADAGVSLVTARYTATACALADGSVIVAGGYDPSGTLLDSAERIRIPATGAATVSSAGTMQYPVRSQRCAALPSGRLVFAGGRQSGGDKMPQLYDPATNAWTIIANTTAARHEALATLSDGRIALVGGEIAGVPVPLVEVLAESGTTIGVTTAANGLIVPRDFPAAASWVDPADGKEKVFVAGGTVDAAATRVTAALESIDLSGASPVSSLLGDRDAMHRTERAIGHLRDGRIAVIGGLDLSATADVATAVFDPATGLMEGASDLPTPSSFGPETVELGDGTVFVGGGEEQGDALIYNGPAAPVAKNPRTLLQVVPLSGTTLAGTSLDGGAGWTLDLYDPYSKVAHYSFPFGAADLTHTDFLVDNEALHAVLTLSSANGDVIAWGATSVALDETRQSQLQTNALDLVVGRVGAFTVSPKSLPRTHGDPAAAPMTDGRVAVIAGASNPTAVDLYDPGTGDSTQGSALGTGRIDTRWFVDGTNLHLVGGLNGGGTAVVAANTVVNLANGSLIAATAYPSPGVHLNWFVPLGAGKVFSYGNSDIQPVPTPDAHLYNGSTWTASASPVTDKRSNERACLIPGDGHVLITAGLTSNGGLLLVSKDAILYDPMADSFTATTQLNTARRDHVAFPSGTNHVTVCGGIPTTSGGATRVGTCETYDSVGKTWTNASNTLSVPRDDSAVVPLGATQELVVGGGMNGGSTAAVDVVDFTNPASVTVAPFASLVNARKDVGAVTMPDGRIEVLAGRNSALTTPNLSSVEVWTPQVWMNPFGYQ